MPRLTYTGDGLREIAFPLGGIGTGTVALGGRGQLRDFEIANRPAKGQAPFRNFFAIGVDDGSGVPRARVLERRHFPPYTGSRGVPVHLLPGLPRFPEAEFVGEYPLARIAFQDDAFPVGVTLDAFNPMIPGDPEDSGLPAAIFTWTFENRGPRAIDLLLVASISNLVGYPFSPWAGDPEWTGGEPVNAPLREAGLTGVLMSSERDAGRHPSAGEMVLASPWPGTTLQTHWVEPDWPYSLRPFWYQLLSEVPFAPVEETTRAAPSANPTVARRPEATLGMPARLAPGERVAIPVVLVWRFPNRYVQIPGQAAPRWVGNHYSTRWPDAPAVARYVVRDRERLESQTRAFHARLFATSVPDVAIDAISANISTIRTQTCFRDSAGQFYAYEGCNPDSGCCPMNCTHVWMYEQALAYLYPSLERSMRENAFLVETDDDGRMYFRARTPRRAEPFSAEASAAADGQMAEIIQLLRDYQISGDRAFLARLWPRAKQALEYAWRPGGWDADRDGVMEGEQHNTTDIAFFGPNPLMTVLYLAALRAGAVIADELDDPATAEAYRRLAAQGARRADELLWNGEYYQQRLDLATGTGGATAGRGQGGAGDATPSSQPAEPAARDAAAAPSTGRADAAADRPGENPRPTELARQVARGTRDASGTPYNQVHDGCLTDQLFGQWLANLVGLGSILDRDRTVAALRAVYRHNFKRMADVPTNFMRAFALNDERGVLYASFPRARGEIIPLTAVFRAHEVWSGCEYEVACHLVQEGLIEEGESIIRAIRARHDGQARNPWNEPECGDHYARAMASYGLLQAYAGLHVDLARGEIRLAPRKPRESYTTFFAVEGAWGTISLDAASLTIDLAAGQLAPRRIVIDDRPIAVPSGTTVTPGAPLTLSR